MNLLAALLVLVAPALQDKVTIKFNPQKGDKLSTTSISTSKFPIDMGEGSVDMESKMTQRRVMHYVDVADGKLTKVTYDCQEEVNEQKGPPNMEWRKTEMPLHGRKITVEMKDGKVVREGADGVQDAALRDISLEDKMSRLFPKREVAVGDAWDVSDEDVKAFLEGRPFQKAKVNCKLTDVKTVDGRRCAVVAVKFDMSGENEQEMEMGAVFEGEAVVWLERGYVLSMKAKGTMKITSPMFNSEGPITADITTKVE